MRVALPLLALALASCGASPDEQVASVAAPQISIVNAEIGETPMGAVGFLTITNDGGPDQLLRVEAGGYGSAEIHRTTFEDGIARMRPAAQIDIPADSSVTFERGGLHIMLSAPPTTVSPREANRLTFYFEQHEPISVTARHIPPVGAE